VDPYILRRYKFDVNGDMNFKRLGVRSVKRSPDALHFLVYRNQGTPDQQQFATSNGCDALTLLSLSSWFLLMLVLG
jgi:hypothetical protein